MSRSWSFPSPPSHKLHSLLAGSGESAPSLPNPTKSFPVEGKMTRANFRQRACRTIRHEVLPGRGLVVGVEKAFLSPNLQHKWKKKSQSENVLTRSSHFPPLLVWLYTCFSKSYDKEKHCKWPIKNIILSLSLCLQNLNGSRPPSRYTYDPSIFAFRSLSIVPPCSPLAQPEDPPCS